MTYLGNEFVDELHTLLAGFRGSGEVEAILVLSLLSVSLDVLGMDFNSSNL